MLTIVQDLFIGIKWPFHVFKSFIKIEVSAFCTICVTSAPKIDNYRTATMFSSTSYFQLLSFVVLIIEVNNFSSSSLSSLNDLYSSFVKYSAECITSNQ